MVSMSGRPSSLWNLSRKGDLTVMNGMQWCNLSQLLQVSDSELCPAMCGNVFGNIRNRALEAMVESSQKRKTKQLSLATATRKSGANSKDLFRTIMNSRSLEVVRLFYHFFKAGW